MDSTNDHGRRYLGTVRRAQGSRALVGLAALAIMMMTPLSAAEAAPGQDARLELAERYAPIIAWAQQVEPCGAGEAFRPVPVEAVLGREGVVLRRGNGDLVVERPEVNDLFGRDADHWLDLPGRALRPNCDYEQWIRDSEAEFPTTVYGRVATEEGHPGWLALQYWLFFPFNDWNNQHEGDWEMIQLHFAVGDVEAALQTKPVEVGYAQHSGAERSAWDNDKLRRQGAHPIVYVATGSHASYFDEAAYLGHSGAEGFGCDNTTGTKSTELAEVVLLPDEVTAASDPNAWLAYEGRWGERNSGPNNGPTGPATKARFHAPITWSHDEWRPTSLAVPGTRGARPSATDVLCSSVSVGSRLYLTYLRTPWLATVSLAAVAGFAVLLAGRTRWGPIGLVDLEHRQPAGVVLRTSVRLYRNHLRSMVKLGLVFVPIGIVTSIALTALLELTRLNRVTGFTVDDPLAGVVFVLLFGSIGSLVATVVVQAGAAHALEQLHAQVPIDVGECYRDTLREGRALGLSLLRITNIIALGALTVVGLPLALLYLARRCLYVQAVAFEGGTRRMAFRRSSQIVKNQGWSVVALVAVINLVAIASGPIVGSAAIVIAPVSLRFANLLTGLVYAVAMPWAGVAMGLTYMGARTTADESIAPRSSSQRDAPSRHSADDETQARPPRLAAQEGQP